MKFSIIDYHHTKVNGILRNKMDHYVDLIFLDDEYNDPELIASISKYNLSDPNKETII